jgi:hypothetical protein
LGDQAKILIQTAWLTIDQKEQSDLKLALLKGEKLPKVWEYVFIASSVALTLFSSWATKQYQLSSFANQTRLPTQLLGEGIFPSMMNSVLTAFMKQMGKKIPDWTRRYGFLGLAIAAVALERELIKREMAPFLFAGPFTSSYLAMLGHESKALIFNR